MSTMQTLAAAVDFTKVDTQADLPYPNIYWITVNHMDHGTFHNYIAGEFTDAAKRKFENWCRETHGFAPHRSNSTIKMRRMLLGDVLQRPEVYDIALDFARRKGETDIVKALDAWLPWIRKTCELGAVDVEATSSLWDRLTSEVERYSRRIGC